MYFASFADFLSMQGHGIYVWASYALGLVLILANLLVPIWRTRRLRQRLQRRLQSTAAPAKELNS
ncbi:heme exporter protein D [Allopseudospirillum japonicum]|uniref:Heme exporter protein D n=1 Tax=Allopseudospirillum japonicum TaxID=64971 RepID=A0A1H6QQX1_9GAMM|nr:heme exporter protein CcmD [Allopseudospirillum japonicum]SEI46218.1 heme exporter protein D [Allopseudospirillum japonicum]